MGRKKKRNLKPWCWYCNREFEDEKVLIGHQKAKHFKCHICHKKLYTAPGLAIHCSQVHKETITKVPNALLERSILDFEIYGMEGIPEEARKMREIEKFGSASSDEPETKKFKAADGGGQAPPNLFPGAPGIMGAPIIVPGMMPPILPGMIPPGATPMGGPGMLPLPNAIPPPVLPGGTSLLPLPPQQPLFPSAVSQSVPGTSGPVNSPSVNSKESATLSGPPSTTNDSSPPSLKDVPLVVPLPENSLLMHPKEDIPMEAIRALRKKYSTTQSSSHASSGTLIPGGPIRPGMGPPQPPPINFSIRPPPSHRPLIT